VKFSEIVNNAVAMLRESGRVSYRALRLEFDLDKEQLDALKEELIEIRELAVEKDARMLVWTGGGRGTPEKRLSPTDRPATVPTAESSSLDAERRQITVMFCDLVGSTALSERLDPEDLREVMTDYQEEAAAVIDRYEGHVAQYLGDGLMVYFGWPVAHEDDPARAVRAALAIVTALFNARDRFAQLVRVRIGIHTGPVVVGQVGGGRRQEQLALGETPNVAARIQAHAEPDTVLISEATMQLVTGLFETEDRGRHALKGISALQNLYRVRTETSAQSRFEVAARTGLTSLVGRKSELSVLTGCWAKAESGSGQVVFLSGEPGIGKSRLVEELKFQLPQDDCRQIEFRCSPYHKNTALFPITVHLQRVLQFEPTDSNEIKLGKLERALKRYRFPQDDTTSLLAALLSLPKPEGASALSVGAQKQKELTHVALVSWLIEESEGMPVYAAWEDLHWADPSTLELLDLLLDQVPTAPILLLLTFRPEFDPPWGAYSYMNHMTLSRLGEPEVNAMVERVTGGKRLPQEISEQIVTKTDGVPLFVEELTKMVVESDLVRAMNDHYELVGPLPPLAIPSTLQDSLMARLDRLATARETAQLGAILGREFNYELLAAVSPLEDGPLRQALKQLVENELVYQRGLPPNANYLFKHALIQDTAYASLLKSRRQQLHQHVALVLEQQFTELAQLQPELVAHHYTEAGLHAQGIPYWHEAGNHSAQRSATTEAVSHLRRGLELVETLHEGPERVRLELELQGSLGPVLIQTQGWAAPETGAAYSRAADLGEQLDMPERRFPALYGLWAFRMVRAARDDYRTARKLAEQLLQIAESEQDSGMRVEAYFALGHCFHLGDLAAAHQHFEQSVAEYDVRQHHALAFAYGQDPAMSSLVYDGLALWMLGYPEQALRQSQAGVALARRLAHPFGLAYALNMNAFLHQLRREQDPTEKQAAAGTALATDQGFQYLVLWGTSHRGWALVANGQAEAGITQIRSATTARRESGAEMLQSFYLGVLADAYRTSCQTETGLSTIAEALAFARRSEEGFYEAELYRVKGELLLQQSKAHRPEAESCFHQAIDIARRQRAKSWELRAATSLARLWQQQGKQAEAHELLSENYNWFTEGFDTKDLQDAKALLEEMG